MTDRMPETRAKLAEEKCDHCREHAHLLEDEQAMFIRIMSPSLGLEQIFHIVCGPCSLELSEWLCPTLVQDPEYICNADQLRAKYRELGWIR